MGPFDALQPGLLLGGPLLLGYGVHLIEKDPVRRGEPEVDAAAGGVGEAGDAASQRRLPASALTDQTQGLPAGDLEADPVDGTHVADHLLEDPLPDREVLLHAANGDDRLAVDPAPGGEGVVAHRGHEGLLSSRGNSAASTPSSAGDA